jgi:transcriptional regulator of arginine metabolism
MMTKSFRHGQILKLIRTRSISTQEELARALKETGVDATQVTLSRDLRELSLVKTPGGYQEMGRPFTARASEYLQDVRLAQNQVVLKTASGHASSIAVALDAEEWPEITGTIAGDDTILVICPDAVIAGEVRNRLMKLVKEDLRR